MLEKSLKKSVIYILIIFCSCKTETGKIPTVNQNKIIYDLNETTTPLKLNLPKTIKPNTELIGEILYKSVFDTIILGKNDRRYINLYITKAKKPITVFTELEKSTWDTLVRVNDSVIFVHDIFFEKEGTYFLEGYIKDEILLDRNSYDDAIITTIETKVTHSIIVKK